MRGKSAILFFVAVFLLVASFASISSAEDFPKQEIRVIVPWAAGGNTDLDGRSIANIVEKNAFLSKPMIVTNITGANTMNAVQAVMDADPDGYTTLLIHNAFIASSAAGTVEIKYSDLKPLVEASIQPFVMVVTKKSGFTSVDQIKAYANENPGKLTIGYVGTGSTSHFASTLFMNSAGLTGKLNKVTYSSSTDRLTALLGGELTIAVGPAADVARYIASGEMIALAVSCENNIDVWKGTPTFKQLGSDVDYACRQGYYVRKEVPQEICDALVASISKAISSKEYAEFCAANGMEPSGVHGAELQSAWDSNFSLFKELIESGQMK